MPIDRQEAKLIQARAIAALEQEFGVGAVKFEGGTIGDALTLKLAITPGGAEARAAAEKAKWDLYAPMVAGLEASDFGRTFKYGAHSYTINGINPSKPKFCISATRADGKPYGLPAEAVKAALMLSGPKQRAA